MTTVGLELTNFIDPNLTWKTVSKGRRSRKTIAKTLKMDSGEGKKNNQRSNEAQSSESDKSDVSVRGRGFTGSLEHIPIKKRRFLLRSPSPPPQLPNYIPLESGQCDLVHETRNTQLQVTCDLQNAPVSRKTASDGTIERTGGRLDVSPVSGEDFSGIAILAAAACSGGLDGSIGDTGKSKIGEMPRRKESDSITSAANRKEAVAISSSTEVLGKGICQLKREGCARDYPIDNSPSVCLRNNVENVVRSDMSELAKTELNEQASAGDRKGSIESKSNGPADLVREEAPLTEESSDLPNDSAEGSSKTLETSGASRDYRLHWDLNTVMDEWDHPLDDTVDPGMQSSEVAQTQCVNPQNNVNDGPSEPPQNSVASESGNLPDCADFTGLFPAYNKPSPSIEVSSHLASNDLKGNLCSSSSPAVVSTINGVMESKVEQGVDADVGNSLSLGFSGKAHNSSTSGSQLAVRIAQPQIHESDFLMVKPLGIASCGDAKPEHSVDFKEAKALDVCENKEAAMISQSLPTEFLSRDKIDMAPAANSFVVADVEGKHFESVEPMDSADGDGSNLAEADSLLAESLPSVSEIAKVGSDDSFGSYSSSKFGDMVAPSAAVGSLQVMDAGISSEAYANTSSRDASIRDNAVGVLFSVPEGATVENCTVDHLKQSGHSSENPCDGICDSHVSNKEFSQVTADTANVADTVGGYDSHLEDGELRESVGHCWDNNEGEAEYGEMEPVDYDSDGREDVFRGAGNGDVQLSGEVLVGEFEKQSFRSDNFSSADDKVNPESLEEHCSLRHQGSLSTACARETECTRLEPPMLKACSFSQPKGETTTDKVEAVSKVGRGSDDEVGSLGKERDSDSQRHARSASSSSGRELQVPDRSVDGIRRSRSSNFDGRRPGEGSGESLARRESSLQTDGFGGQSGNVELKGDVDADNGAGVTGVSDYTSPRARGPCIIPTSRSGYNLIRRKSPGERDNNYGSGMVRDRDFSPNNLRGRFDRFSNGMYRGSRDGYRRPGLYDGGKSSGPMLNNFAKSDRSFSPFDDRAESYFPRGYRKSRSRSRTRSPDFRSETRMGRPSLPYQSAGHTANHMRDRRSPVRVFNQRQRFDSIGSAGRLRSDDCTRPVMRPRFQDTSTSGRDCNYGENNDYRRKPQFLRGRRSRSRSRSFSPDFRSDGRMGPKRPPYQPPVDHMRGRRSPVRDFHPGQRYDNGRSPGRLRSDDGMRPMMRPVRYGQDYNNGGGDFGGKPRNIFERIHPRNYDADGDGRRMQYDEQDDIGSQNFRRNDNYARGGDGRPAEGFRREDRGNVRYNSDRMFGPGPKQFGGGMRDYADDSLPRGVRPG